MKIVRIRGKEVVVGLNWHLLPPGQSESKAIKSLLTAPAILKEPVSEPVSPPPGDQEEAADKGKKGKGKSKDKGKEPASALEAHAGVNHGAVVKVPGNTVVGLPSAIFVDGKAKRQKKPKAPSAAAWLALANQAIHNEGNGSEQASGFSSRHWAVVEQMPDSDDYWLVAIKDQVPLPGTDVITTREDVLGMLNELIDAFGNIEIYTPDEDIRNNMPADCQVFPKGLAELVDKVKPSKAHLVQIRGIPPIVFICVLFLFLAGMGYWGWAAYEKKKAAEFAAANRAAQKRLEEERKSQEQKAYEQQVRKAILNALTEGVNDVQTSLKSPSPKVVMQEWQALFETTPISQAAWSVTSVNCEMETAIKPSCVVNLARGSFGIDRLIREVISDVEIDGEKAGYWKRGQDKAERDYSWKQLPLQEAFLLDLTSNIQLWKLAGWNMDLGKASEIVKQVRVPPVPALLFKPGKAQQAVPVPPVQLGVARGDLTVTGTGLWQAKGLLDLIDVPNVSLASWMINPVDQTWSMTVGYFVRSKPRPVLPPVTLPNGQVITADLPPEYDPEPTTAPAPGATPATDSAPAPSAQERARKEEDERRQDRK